MTSLKSVEKRGRELAAGSRKAKNQLGIQTKYFLQTVLCREDFMKEDGLKLPTEGYYSRTLSMVTDRSHSN